MFGVRCLGRESCYLLRSLPAPVPNPWNVLGDFQESTPSNGFSSPEFETESRKSSSSKEFCWQTFPRQLGRAMCGACQNQDECAGFNPRLAL